MPWEGSYPVDGEKYGATHLAHKQLPSLDYKNKHHSAVKQTVIGAQASSKRARPRVAHAVA